MIKTISLLGVVHDVKLCHDYTEWILDNYPSVKTVMLELPLEEGEVKRTVESPFFSSLEGILLKNGKDIIYGDTGKVCLTKKELDILDGVEEKNPPFKAWVLYAYVMTKLIGRNIFSGKRNKEFLKNVREYEPDLVILGSAHTNYLRKHLPDTHYVRFEDEYRSELVGSKPDRSMTLKDIERYGFNKLMTKRKSPDSD